MTTKTQSSEAARIVTAAMSLVAEVGFEGLTMRGLARRELQAQRASAR